MQPGFKRKSRIFCPPEWPPRRPIEVMNPLFRNTNRIKETKPSARIANVAQFEKAFAAAVPTLAASMLQAQESPLLIKCTATGTQMQLVLTNKNPSTRPQMSAKTD